MIQQRRGGQMWATRRTNMDNLITVETDLFEHRVVKPHFINPCCFGEDFAAWLRDQLSTLSASGFVFSDPIQEDHGWGFWASRDKNRFWIGISYVGDGPQEAPAQWVISVNYDPGLNLINRLFHNPERRTLEQLRECVLAALTSNISIKPIQAPCYAQDPTPK